MIAREIRTFDRDDEVVITQRNLPHWSQPNTIAFITFRTNDSMPKVAWQRFWKARARVLAKRGLDASSIEFQREFAILPGYQKAAIYRQLSLHWNRELDYCLGRCELRNPEIAQLIGENLKYFDSIRYDLTDFVVMPNHLHLLAAFRDSEEMLKQCENWKRYTATRINRIVGRTGKFWQQDGFDHLVRSESDLRRYRRYIELNPQKAQLKPNEYLHYSKPLTT